MAVQEGGGGGHRYSSILATLMRLLGESYDGSPNDPREEAALNMARLQILDPPSARERSQIEEALTPDLRDWYEFALLNQGARSGTPPSMVWQGDDEDFNSIWASIEQTTDAGGKRAEPKTGGKGGPTLGDALGVGTPGAGDRDPRPSPSSVTAAGTGGNAPAVPGGGGGGAGAQLIDTPAGDPGGTVQVPGGGQVWQIGNDWYMVYNVPGTDIPMRWHIEDQAQLEGIFSGRAPTPDRVLPDEAAWKALGGLNTFGGSKELINTSEHPFDQFLNTFSTEAAIRPWLRDPEILALTAMGILEGREVSEGELKTTDWWQDHSEAERQWISLSASDPATASQQIADRRNAVRAQMQAAGVTANDDIVNFIADKWTSGMWSQDRTMQQISELANPASAGGLDRDLKKLIDPLEESGELVRAADDTTLARNKVLQFLGPLAAEQFSDEQLRDWGRAMRSSEHEVTKFEGILSKQFETMFPEYAGTGATYEDVAGTARALFQQVWGTKPDEKDPLFLQVARTQDLEAAAGMLRKRGVERGVTGVVNDALGGLLQASGGQVRGVI